jgi:hypothetical protein
MNQYLYLIAYVNGSEYVNEETTGVYEQADLLPQYLAGNTNVFAVKANIPFRNHSGQNDDDETLAVMYGESAAFRAGFSYEDTTSICMWVPFSFVYPYPVTEIYI